MSWVHGIEPQEPHRPSASEERRARDLRKQIQELRSRGSGVVKHFGDVNCAAIQRAKECQVVSPAIPLLEELTQEARSMYDAFGRQLDALFSEANPPAAAEPAVIPPRAERRTVAEEPLAPEFALEPFDPSDAAAVGEHLHAVVAEADAAADAEGAAQDTEGTGVFRLFQKLLELPVSEWPLVKALLKEKKSSGTIMQLGVLLPVLLFGGVGESQARGAHVHSTERAQQGLPKVDKTYSEEELIKNPELVRQIYQKFHAEWQLLQGGDSIPQTNERYVMPPFVLIKFMEPHGEGKEKEFTPHFIAQLVEKDLNKHGEKMSDDLIGRHPMLLENEQDWQRVQILMDQLLVPVPRMLSDEERAILIAAAERERVFYGDPVPVQDPRVVVADSGRVYPTDAPHVRSGRPSPHRRQPSMRQTTVGPTGLPLYTIGSGLARQFSQAHLQTPVEGRAVTLQLMEATFGPQPDAVPTETVPPASEPSDETAVVAAADRERLNSLTSYFASVFDTARTPVERVDALQGLMDTYGTPTPDGGKQYRLDQMLFHLHDGAVSIDIHLRDGSTKSLQLSSDALWSEFDRLTQSL